MTSETIYRMTLISAKDVAIERATATAIPYSVLDLCRDGTAFAICTGAPDTFPRVDRERIVFTAEPLKAS